MKTWLINYWNATPAWGLTVLALLMVITITVLILTWRVCQSPEVYDEEDYYDE